MTKIRLETGEEIEMEITWFGGGVIDSLCWGKYQPVNLEKLTGLQVYGGGCFRNTETPKMGDLWSSVYCGQAGSIFVPFSSVREEEKNKVEKFKIIWIGKIQNDFNYDKKVCIMEMQTSP